MRHVLALLLLEGFLFAFFLRCGGCATRCCWFCHKTSVSKFQSFKFQSRGLRNLETSEPSNLSLCLCRRLLLLGDRSFARTFARPGVRVCALPADRQVAAMAESAIGADFDESLDVHRNFLAQIALDQALLLDDRANAVDLFFAEVLDLLHRLDLRFVENASRARMADPVNIGQRDVDVLLAGKIHACNTCHS